MGGYDITDLLTLALSERAAGLSLRSGQPPKIRVGNEDHAIEGPPITHANGDSLLRSLVGTRYMRIFRGQGAITFVYTFQNSARFQIEAKLKSEEIQIEITRLVD